ncbi:MAG: prenyltransferase, partial [Chloroflexi bacterium]|nr:prenyltransferase [Chloroflexota bacterium]
GQVNRIQKWVRITRAPFFTAVIIPALLGALVARSEGTLHLGYLLLTLVGVVAINGGLNMSNDYFDHLSGNDAYNLTPTPFSGGSRAIQEGVLTPGGVLAGSLAFYVVGIAVGIYLTAVRGWGILAIGFVGVLIAVLHNAPRIGLYYLAPGVGELATGLACGLLVVLGSYYVQTQRFASAPLFTSLPIAFLVSAILYANEFPDAEADRRVGKKTLPVVLGERRAVQAFTLVIVAAYISLIVEVLLGAMPTLSLLGLLTAPLGYRAIQGVKRYHSDVPRLIPALATTIQLHLAMGLLLCIGYLVAPLFS